MSPNSPHNVTVPNGTWYYMGVFPVTDAQYTRVMGTSASSNKKPKGSISWSDIRGTTGITANPSANANGTAFFQRLNGKTGLAFDLPTEKMWEVAARAGVSTAYISGNSLNYTWMWVGANSGNVAHDVGNVPANNWGLYDVYGNVWEWCRDVATSEDTKSYTHDIYTPHTSSGSFSNSSRRHRGAAYQAQDRFCYASYRGGSSYMYNSSVGHIGFRVALIVRK